MHNRNTPSTEEHTGQDEELEFKSKTQIKNEMLDLQKLGRALTELKACELDQLPIDENLREAIDEAKKIKTGSAKKRQLQYVGKLIRNSDYQALAQAHQLHREQRHALTRHHHSIETWRDQLISDPKTHLAAFIERHPGCDIQKLRQLVRSAQKEAQIAAAPKSARKLFQFIRDTLDL